MRIEGHNGLLASEFRHRAELRRGHAPCRGAESTDHANGPARAIPSLEIDHETGPRSCSSVCRRSPRGIRAVRARTGRRQGQSDADAHAGAHESPGNHHRDGRRRVLQVRAGPWAARITRCVRRSVPTAACRSPFLATTASSTSRRRRRCRAMPGDAQNARLRPFAEQKVTISGKVFAAGGANAIQITRGASPAKSMNESPWRAPPRSARSLRPTSRGLEPIGRRVILPSRARYRRLAEAACLCTCSIPPMMLPLRSFSLRC